MFNRFINIWAYWDWFMVRQGVKGAKNRIQRSFALGAIEAIIPTLGVCSVMGIFFRTVGANIHPSNKGFALWIAVTACIAPIFFIGSKRRKSKDAEFKAYDIRLIKKYDRFVWIFTLSCVAAFVIMLIIGR